MTVPRTSPTRLRPLPWGGTTPPSPAPPDVSPHTASGWEDLAVRRQRLPRASRGCPCATSLAVAASCALARLSLRQSSLFHRLFQPPQQASACARALTTVTSCVCISLSPLSVLTPQHCSTSACARELQLSHDNRLRYSMPTRAYCVTKSCSVGWLTPRSDAVRVMLPLFVVKARPGL